MEPSATAASTKSRRKRGRGDSVAKVRRLGTSLRRRVTTFLMSRLPKGMPRRPRWALEMP